MIRRFRFGTNCYGDNSNERCFEVTIKSNAINYYYIYDTQNVIVTLAA